MAIPRNLAKERAKRRARIEHHRERKRARIRFFVLVCALVFLATVIALSIWETIQAAFGI